MTTEGARQLTRMNLVGSNKDEKDDHIFACHDAIRWLAQRLDEEIKWGHRECTHDDCKSSGTDCPANNGLTGGGTPYRAGTGSQEHRP